MRNQHWAMPTLALIGAGVLQLSACEGVQIGGDALSMHLTPRQAQVCRDAVRDVLLERNVSEDWIRRIHYQAIRRTTRGTGTRISGFEAWVYPKEGRGALVVELTEVCHVRRIWAQGTR